MPPTQTHEQKFLLLFFKKEDFLPFFFVSPIRRALHQRSAADKLKVIENYSQLEACAVGGFDGGQISRRCERAVVTAYRELRRAGTDDMAAFQSCTTLYRIHHPEASINEARRLVAEWIDHHVVKERSGPTRGCAC